MGELGVALSTARDCAIIVALEESRCGMVNSTLEKAKTKKVRTRKGKRPNPSNPYEKMTLAEYIKSQCKDRKSTLAFLKRVGWRDDTPAVRV